MQRSLFPILFLFAFTPLTGQKIDMSIFHGMTPRNIGPAGMSGRVTDIEVVLEDVDNIYIGTAAGGVWKSENAGHTWTPIFDDQLAASIGDVTVFQKNPNIIYVGSGEGNPRNSHNSGWGMFKSIDGGRSWTHLGLENTRQIHRVIVHPDNPDVVLAGVAGSTWGESEDRGVYKSVDGGKTWKKVLYVNDITGIADMRMDPHNPNKIIAAMYEHRRWPWYYKSGGKGSAIYISNDGGDSWEKVSEGLPEEELGRIGLAFAPSKKDWIYAYVESSDNAIFRSTDGGYTWERRSRSGDGNIGGRPFYYADIYVDTKNENRVYSIASEVTSTEDGGRTWQVFAPGNRIHTDHHAYWIHPDDPEFIMVGHDGGLNITHDRGKNWWFADNLPLAQFYHLRVDNELPYNVYGGTQDNGSWIGPSQVSFKGGIRNFYWQRVSVGDGFDVVPDPKDSDYGYSMGQAGGLYRYHRPSGQLQIIKPTHPEGEYLRFNWNAGIGIDPHDEKTVYYGSQYVHKSADYGQSWEIISPDLTSNDPKKQDFLESGGLTYDATGAENHTTIISIAPCPLEEGVIWVGTDDGNVQLTRNGGKEWTNVTKNIPGFPEGGWVAQIQPSKHRKGEAFVTVDDHWRNNWVPYIWRTRNYGKSWERILKKGDIRSFAYCFEQDPVAENLYFCGTEFGLYVSFDAGENWNQWTVGYPTVPTRDLVIHPRDHDLVIGTFGRSFWILDDIRPLREMAQSRIEMMKEKNVHLFQMPDAYLFAIGESIGYRDGKVGEALYNGENRAYGALITYYLKDVDKGSMADLPLDQQVKIAIKDANGKTVRHLYQKPKGGVNRLNWELDRDAVRSPNRALTSSNRAPRGGYEVVPGTYTVEVSYKDQKSSGKVVVHPDPLLKITKEEMQGTDALIARLYKATEQVTAVMDQIRATEVSIKFIEDKMKMSGDGHDKLEKTAKSVKKEIKAFKEKIFGKEVQGIYSDPMAVTSMIGAANRLIPGIQVPPSQNRKVAIRLAEEAVAGLEKDFEQFKNTSLKELKSVLKNSGMSLID
jgi:photosystem II stability/assembly factor-like uncharacterized protein